MPLLRLKPFKPEVVPKHLKADDEVFLCDLTGEVFTNYEAFYQRMILCNSLVWSCEISGKVNLTYKEAQENEKTIRKSLSAIPYSLKLGMLFCVHHTRRSKIQDLTDEIYEYFKTRYQIDEKVEVKINIKDKDKDKDKWVEAIISELPYSVDISLQNKLNNQKSLSPINSPSKEKLKAFCTILASLKSKSPLENKELKPDTSDLSYKVLILTGPRKGETVVLKRRSIRRMKKGVFVKDKVKLFLKETCYRSSASSDDGFWVVQKKEANKYELGQSCIIKPNNSLASLKNKLNNNKKKTVKSYMERPQNLALEQKKLEQRRIEQEQEREKKRLELEALREQREQKLKEEKALREQKLKEKEEEKARRKDEREEEKARKRDEREKERELNIEKKNLELDFVREFNKVKEDLLLEDSKALPVLAPLKSSLDKDLIGGAIMVVEFVNTFADLFDLEQEIDGEVNLGWLEEALLEHDAEGNYFTILKFLLHSYLRLDKEENNYEPDDDDDGSSSDNSTGPVAPQTNLPESFKDEQKKASANASAAAAWSMLHQGMALSDISIEPFSLTEVLRLHILSSGIRIGGIVDWNEWQRRGQNQLSDDPCVSFRHQEQEIMKRIMTSSVYDLSPNDKLKILNLLCDQCLMLSSAREFMEDAYDKVKILRKELREIQFEENQRRRKLQKEKWKKKVAERKKLKEETKLKKEKKLLEMQQHNESNPGTPVEGSADILTDKKEVDNEDEPADDAIDLKEQQEKELERKRKKEEKEQQADDFYHEKFLFREKEILKEIAEHSGRISETPVGTDRYFRRFWNFNYVDGLFVENDEDALFIPSESDSDDSDTENEGDNEMSEDEDDPNNKKENINTTTPMPGDGEVIPAQEDKNGVIKTAPSIPSIQKVTFEDIMNAKQEAVPLTRLILNRYGCNYTERSEDFVSKSAQLTQLMENINNGIDPRVLQKDNIEKWYDVCDKETYEGLLGTLNMRGVRESNLHTGLSNAKQQIISSYEEGPEKLASKKAKSGKDQDSNDIDKSLFETMDDYIEGNLRDHLLEIEERLWVGGIGAIKCQDRIKWRTDIEQGMVKLIKYDRNNIKPVENSKQEIKAEESMEEGKIIEDVDVSLQNGLDSSIELRGENEAAEEAIKDEVTSPGNTALPSHLKSELSENISRCSTPVNVPENEKLAVVKELAEALLLIQNGIEKKFLKPPLGETEEIKQEKLKERLEAVNAGGDNSKEEDEKKSSTCLSRWEESLISCISFAQIFIHLDTLDRSILWDKSIQNTKCRLCRRKGNEDEMLLCDGCDRGFHMSCLKPKLKSVPEGDWFCHDCRPIEIKRRNRKLSVRVEDDTEEEDESEEETEEEDSQDSDSQSDGEEDDEEDEDEDDDDSVVVSEHGEHCTVCNEEGTLILCDDCPRSYHVGCCYPRIKKVPRGNWSCQICTGLDKELYWKKRAKTIEKKRERALLESQVKPKKKQYKKKQQRVQSDVKVKATKEKKRNSSPLVNNKPAKKAKLENNDSSPVSSTQRSSGLFRFQLKHCSTLINEIFNQKEVEDFLIPVDIEEVPDYLDFIDKPMDFGKIKRKLNMAKYVDIQDFLGDINLVFSNCETYNPPRSRVYREGVKLKSFVMKRVKELGLG